MSKIPGTVDFENKIENPENNPVTDITFELEVQPETIEIDKEQLQALIQQNQELKADLGELLTVFSSVSGLFTGKVNMLTLSGTIMKLLKNDAVLAQFGSIEPILNKYKTP